MRMKVQEKNGLVLTQKMLEYNQRNKDGRRTDVRIKREILTRVNN